MDIVLDACDKYLFTPYLYPTTWQETHPLRQILSLLIIANASAYILYFLFATLSYFLLFDKRLMEHPQFIKNQVQLEIQYTVKALPFMSIPTCAIFFFEVRGYSKLYDNVESTLGMLGIVVTCFTFILFTDCLIYWIHCYLHHRTIYKYIHKDHHRWKVTTPFASHAFHPIDGFLQSVPYHIYPFLFPLHKYTYLVLFVFVNIWTISIHDGNYKVPDLLKPFINGSAHHTDHHLFYNYNYGQFFTLWDRIGGSFRKPSHYDGNGPLDEVLRKKALVNANGVSEKKEM